MGNRLATTSGTILSCRTLSFGGAENSVGLVLDQSAIGLR